VRVVVEASMNFLMFSCRNVWWRTFQSQSELFRGGQLAVDEQVAVSRYVPCSASCSIG